MNVCGVTFGGYLTKILSFKTGNLLNKSKFHLLSESTVDCTLAPDLPIDSFCINLHHIKYMHVKWVQVSLTNQAPENVQ